MKLRTFLTIFAVALLFAVTAHGFGGDGCGAGECVECHSLSTEQATDALSNLGVSNIVGVEMSEVPGLWSVHIAKDGVTIPVFLDFSLRYLIQGEAVEVASRTNITRMEFAKLNPVDVSKIPLENSLVVGDPNAKYKLIVFDDPNCSYCGKLHESMKELVKTRPDIAFFIKVYPLKKGSYDKAKAILCENSMELLEKSFAGEQIPAPSCETDQVEKNIALAKANRVSSTPTLIFPDGRVIKGYKSPDDIVKLLNAGGTAKTAAPK